MIQFWQMLWSNLKAQLDVDDEIKGKINGYEKDLLLLRTEIVYTCGNISSFRLNST